MDSRPGHGSTADPTTPPPTLLQVVPVDQPADTIAASTYSTATALLPPPEETTLDEAAADLAAELSGGSSGCAALEPGSPPESAAAAAAVPPSELPSAEPAPAAEEAEKLEAAVAAALGLAASSGEPAIPPPRACSSLHLSLELQVLEALGDLMPAGGTACATPTHPLLLPTGGAAPSASLLIPSPLHGADSFQLCSPLRSSPALNADAEADKRFSGGLAI